MSTPESTVDNRVHVPLGADVELYNQMGDWAPSIAGFQRFDLKHDTPGIAGAPGITLADLSRGDAVLDSWHFVVEPFDYSGTSAYVQGLLAIEGVDGYVQSFSIDQLNDWNAVAVAGEGLFGTTDPLVFTEDATISFYIGDQQEQDPGSTQGWLVLVLRVLPSIPTYPG